MPGLHDEVSVHQQDNVGTQPDGRWLHYVGPWACSPLYPGAWLLKDRVGVGIERLELSRRSGGGMGPWVVEQR